MAATNKTLVFLCPSDRRADVATQDLSGMFTYETLIGHVELNQTGPNAGLWSARDLEGTNHGDRYNRSWDAAKQLALALGKGEYVR